MSVHKVQLHVYVLCVCVMCVMCCVRVQPTLASPVMHDALCIILCPVQVTSLVTHEEVVLNAVQVPIVRRAHHRLNDCVTIPLKAALKWALMLMNEPQCMAKLMQNASSVDVTQIHGLGFFWDVHAICANVRPRTRILEIDANITLLGIKHLMELYGTVLAPHTGPGHDLSLLLVALHEED